MSFVQDRIVVRLKPMRVWAGRWEAPAWELRYRSSRGLVAPTRKEKPSASAMRGWNKVSDHQELNLC